MTNQDLADAIIRLETKVDALSKTIDELTGAKKFLMWLTGTVLVGVTAIATWAGTHHK